MWLHQDLIERVMGTAFLVFDEAAYLDCRIPTYPCGQIGVLIAQKATAKQRGQSFSSFKQAKRPLPASIKTRFYNTDYHLACFKQPTFFHEST